LPTDRARIAYVNGETFDFSNPETRQQRGQIGREFAVTYRPNLDSNETSSPGDWWNERRTKRRFPSKKKWRGV
jgi:predicted lysophospholipase L1 biosynthesis ABC-type transport system permease subunit